MKIWFCPNGFTLEQNRQALECMKALEQFGHQISVSLEDRERLSLDDSYASFIAKESDLIVSLGGDGSVLRAAKVAIASQKPLFGINSGRLGYLCSMNYSEIEKFDEILSESICIDRDLLECVYEKRKCFAVNDLVIAKKNFGETVDLMIRIDEEQPFNVRGDGIILATPTGSSAYNLSSGGAVLDPESESVVLTPICPHASHAYPIVLNNKRQVRVAERNDQAQIYADGNFIGNLSGELRIYKSSRVLSLYTGCGAVNSIIRFS